MISAPEVKPGDLVKGTVIRVPAAGRSRPYCLEVIEVITVSKQTGAAEVSGKVVAADGTTARKRPLFRTVVLMPARVTIVKKPSAPPA